MKKIISLFKRDYDGTRLVYDDVVEGAEWVQAGEGFATRKWDGTCCMVQGGVLWKRYEVKKGKTPPEGFLPATDPDPNTGKQQGWVMVGDGPEDQYHREAFDSGLRDGTYELVGPKIQGNPDGFDGHVLIPHGETMLDDVPRTYDGLKAWFEQGQDLEGVVWWHPDGRMVKIKAKDFGVKR